MREPNAHLPSAITLCSIPKAFTGIYSRLQHNALQNWIQVLPPENIVLFGDELGVAEAARRYGCQHQPCLVNDFGTPILSDVFSRAASLSHAPYLAFVNADILLDLDLQETIRCLIDAPAFSVSGFLGVARRWNLDVPENWDAAQSDSFLKLKEKALLANDLYPPVGMDLFVFPRTFFAKMPPFSIGWPGAKYDNWMLWYARSKRLSVVDMTAGVTLIHQNHPGFSGEDTAVFVEHWRNLRFAGGYGHCYDLGDVTHVLDASFQIHRHRSIRPLLYLRRCLQRCRDLCRFEWM
jgi:hypothetical protein